MNFTHLVYVRKYSVSTNDTALYVYGVNTPDIFHTMGEMQYRMDTKIERISFAELTPKNTQAKLDFLKNENIKIQTWYDKYPYSEKGANKNG